MQMANWYKFPCQDKEIVNAMTGTVFYYEKERNILFSNL